MRLVHGMPLLFAATISLAACGKGGQAARTSDSASTSSGGVSIPGAAPHAPDTGKKLDGYIKGYNTLIGTFGLKEEYEGYANQHIAERSAANAGFINVNVGWMDNALTDLKAARAIPARMDELDAVGDKFVPVLDRLIGRLKGLDTYYKSKGYLEDNFARGKREDPLVLADFKTLMDGIDPLSAAIDHEQDKRDQRLLAALKSDGDQIGYDSELAMQRSKALLRLFRSKADLADAGKIKQGDDDVAQIEQALAEERKLLADLKASPNHDFRHSIRNSGAESAAGYLETMIGAYRELKRSGSATDHQQMVAAYNQAVEQVNMMH